MKQKIIKCCVSGCINQGKVIGHFSGKPLAYCRNHLPYGSRVFNGMVNDIIKKKHDEYWKDIKQRFKKIEFCDDCASKIFAMVTNTINDHFGSDLKLKQEVLNFEDGQEVLFDKEVI